MTNNLCSLIDFYYTQGAPDDQQMLIALLRDAQKLDGGALTESTIQQICEIYRIKDSIVKAIIRRVPSLKLITAPNTLEICGTCGKARELTKYIEDVYALKSGDSSLPGKFTYRVTGCMKNCKKGPSIRWNGDIISQVTIEMLKQLLNSVR